mgnify:CR=1 FL=1
MENKNNRLKMHSLRVVGGKPIRGTVVASGSRNAATKLIIASLLSDKRCTFFNVPDVGDVATTLAMCKEVGMEYVWDRQAKVLDRQEGWAQIDRPSGWSNETYLSFS